MSVERLADRVLGLVTWAKVTASRALAGKIGVVWTKASSTDQLHHHQPYGLQSRPKPGADAIVVSMGSSAEDRIVLQVGDRRWTIALEEGEVAVADDLGQKVHLTRTGIVVDSGSIKLGGAATLKVARETDPVVLDAGLISWLNTVSTAAFTDPPVGAHVPLTTGVATGAISNGSSVTRSE